MPPSGEEIQALASEVSLVTTRRGFLRYPQVEILEDRQKDRQHGISPLPKIVTVKEILIRAEPVSGFRTTLHLPALFPPDPVHTGSHCARIRIMVW